MSAPFHESWYCLHTAPKQEKKVGLLLKRELGLRVFAPNVRFRRMRAGTAIWATEALFPGYLFARFSFSVHGRRIATVSGVTSIVSFGGVPAAVASSLIDGLESAVGETDLLQIDPVLVPGNDVFITTGPLRGIRALVSRVIPARRRVAILLKMLGAYREIEIEQDRTVLENPRRTAR
jgi:transcriptional antiterminator RfaH